MKSKGNAERKMTEGDYENLCHQLFELANKFWEQQDIRDNELGKIRTAVKWIQKEGSELVVITRGEYSEEIKKYVELL